MGKRIVVCCDGTWNTPDKTKSIIASGNKKIRIPCATNVVKIALAVRSVSNIDGKKQLTYYDPGIGTSGWFLERWFDGATGYGISKNIIQAYKFLLLNFEIGDELFLFGFSRGAFTVRSLAGLIRNSGILKINEVSLIKRAYKLYKSRSPSTHPNEKEARLFRKTFAVADIIPIKYIGVWDTVGALGNPLFLNTVFSKISLSIVGNQFHDTDLSSTVSYAYQALAIDEKRRQFKPTLWQKREPSDKNNYYTEELEQVWFKGVHSNIGGGIESTGLSDIALKWMLGKAKKCNLDFDEIDTTEDASEKIKESRKGFYRLMPPLYRKIGVKPNGFESVDITAKNQFFENNKYKPRNLKEYFDGPFLK